jgi:hypothetical protein
MSKIEPSEIASDTSLSVDQAREMLKWMVDNGWLRDDYIKGEL